MSFPLFITKKQISSKYSSNYLSFISLISIGGIALGVAVLIIAMTILDGFEKAVEDKIISFNSHIKITAFSKQNLIYSDQTIKTIQSVCGQDFESASPFLLKQAIIRSKKLSEGITVTGIDPSIDNSSIKSFIVDGDYTFIDNNGKVGVIVGKKLSEKLFIEVGDRITLFTLFQDKIPSIENPPAIAQYYVTGIFESGMADYDDLNIYMDLNNASKLFGLEGKISGYNIKLSSLTNLEEYSSILQEKLRYPHYSRSIYRVHQNIFTWLDLQKEPIPIVLGLITLVAVFNIVGTLLLMVLERLKSIGILKTLGAGNRQIIQIFLIQGLIISVIGIIVGCALSFILSYIQIEYGLISLPDSVYFLNEVPISIEFKNYLIVAGAAFVMSVFASLIPSYYATKTDPVNAIKFE